MADDRLIAVSYTHLSVTLLGIDIVPAKVFTSLALAKLVTAPTKQVANTRVFNGFIIYVLPLEFLSYTLIPIV